MELNERMAAAMREVTDEFDLVIINRPDELDDALRLRYQVYCLERGFEPAEGGREIDGFDVFARHAILRNRVSHQAVGTVRLVVPALGGASAQMPIDQICGTSLLRNLPRKFTGEISRFSLSKRYRGESGIYNPLLRLFLMRGVVALSKELGLTHWCALMEPCLLRLLRTSSIHFRSIGAPVDHHGLRQPSYAVIENVLAQLALEQPSIWDFVTEGGSIWQKPQLALTA